MIHIFQKGFWPSIKVKINQRGYKLDSFRETIEKVVDAEATAKLMFSFNTYEMDQNCPWGNRPVQPTVTRFPHRARLTEDP